MSVYVFLGPSLPLEEARQICTQAIILPPVRLGDVWRAAAFGGAHAIGIIDGYFERVPAVWHKEILWAIGNGVAVAGAASMGALRAAELEAFGMTGIGRIFEAFRNGRFAPFEEPFEDDDEVAVSHGPAEAGFLSSEAMVNIRATLAAAAQAGVIDDNTRDRLAAFGKQLFYKQRSWATLLRRAAHDGCAPEPLAALRDWLPEGRIDQKRADAAALMHWLAEPLDDVPDARFSFADTTLWHREIAALPEHDEDDSDTLGVSGRDSGSSRVDDLAVLDELRLRIDDWQQEREAVWTLLLGSEGDPSSLSDIGPIEPEAALQLLSARANREERRLRRLGPASRLIDAMLLDRLRASGSHDQLRRRAAAKRHHLQRSDAQSDAASARSEAALISWFATRCRSPLPEDTEALAELLDLPDATTLLELLAAEHAFVAMGFD